MDTGINKRPNWTGTADQVGGKHHKFEYNDLIDKRDQIGDFGRGSRPAQYREERNLQGTEEDKNSMPVMRCGYKNGIHNNPLPKNTWNRYGDLLRHHPGEPTRALTPII